MSARKRRHKRISKRIARHKFRSAEKASMRGDKVRASHFGDNWHGVPGMRAKNLP